MSASVLNLITSAWLPVRRRDGATVWRTPAEALGDPEAIGLAFPRPDMNGAVLEWLIGVVAAVRAPDEPEDWEADFETPPAAATLAGELAVLVPAFDLFGDGPRAFQAFERLEDQAVATDEDDGKAKITAQGKGVSVLLFDEPSGQTLNFNADVFRKRGGVEALSLPYAAAALIAHQTYATQGGRGHRTSMRGGGPLTTLAGVRGAGGEAASLWHQVWVNVPERGTLERDDPVEAHDLTAAIFPWMGPTKVSEKDQRVAPGTRPGEPEPLMAYFACPRPVRLIAEPPSNRACSLGGPAEHGLVARIATRQYGANYVAWEHPHTAYYASKPKKGEAAEWLPVRPAGDLASYRHWLGLVSGSGDRKPASAVTTLRAREPAIRAAGFVPHVRAFGYESESAKIVQWHEETPPFVQPAPGQEDLFKMCIGGLLDAAAEALRDLKGALALASFGQREQGDADGAPAYKAREVNLDVFGAQAQLFWRRTEPAFRKALNALATDAEDAGEAVRRSFLSALSMEARRIFDEATAGLAVDYDAMRRHAFAARRLPGSAKLAKAAGLAPPERGARRSSKPKKEDA
jgi:CRISPR system Cascade subunit CasA